MPTLRELNEALKLHLATLPPEDLEGDWTIIVEYYVQQAAKIQNKPEPTLIATEASSPMLPSLQLQHAKDATSTPEHKRYFRFLDLPKELRHTIYEMIVTPDIAAAHVTKNKFPALLQVSHPWKEDFAKSYFSSKVFKVDLIEPSTRSWEEVQNPNIVRAMFEEWTACHMNDSPLIAYDRGKRNIELELEHGTYAFLSNDINWTRKGMLTWTGGPQTEGVQCRFSKDARFDPAGSRMKTLSWLHERTEKRRKVDAGLGEGGLFSNIFKPLSLFSGNTLVPSLQNPSHQLPASGYASLFSHTPSHTAFQTSTNPQFQANVSMTTNNNCYTSRGTQTLIESRPADEAPFTPESHEMILRVAKAVRLHRYGRSREGASILKEVARQILDDA